MKIIYIILIFFYLNGFSNINDTIKDNIRDKNSLNFSITGIPDIALSSEDGILAFGIQSEYSFFYYPIDYISIGLTYTNSFQNNYDNSLVINNRLYNAFSTSARYFFDKRRSFFVDIIYSYGKYIECDFNSNNKTGPLYFNKIGFGLGYSYLIRNNLGFLNNRLELLIEYKYLWGFSNQKNIEEFTIPMYLQFGLLYNI